MLTGARHRAAHSKLGEPCATNTVMVAERAATAQWRSVGVARATPHFALPLAMLSYAGAPHARVLVRVVVAAEALTAPKRGRDGIRARSMHLAPLAEPRCAFALPLRRPSRRGQATSEILKECILSFTIRLPCHHSIILELCSHIIPMFEPVSSY